ncbi:MAG: hypothetical protein ACK4M7_00900 [Burkholderiales bacterium]
MKIIYIYYINFCNHLAELTSFSALGYKKRLAMYRMLEKMTAEPASLPINDAVLELQTLEIAKDRKTRLWYIYEDIIDKMRNSDANFTKAAAKYIPQQDTMIIAASEQDDITLGFKTVIDNNAKANAMKKAFINALTYPLFLVVVLLFVLYYFSIKIIPSMLQTIPSDVTLSATSLALVTLVGNFKLWFSSLVLILILSIGFMIWALPNLTTVHRKYLEDIPPFNMYRLMVGCGFLFALNSLGKAGFMMIDALSQMIPLAKPYLRYRIEIIMELMADGMDVGQALIHSKLDFPDKQMIRELSIQVKYSEDNSLDILSTTLVEDGLETIRRQATGFKIVISVIVFSLIGFLYLGIYNLGMDMGNTQAGIIN